MANGEHAPTQASPASTHQHTSDLLLCCEDLVIGYQGKALLPPINLQVRRGTFLAVIGRNGSGKSTWFKTLLGLQNPVSGRVFRSGPDVRSAYVPQSSGIDGMLPVRSRELVHWGRLSGWNFLRPFSTQKDRMAVEAALESAGAGPIANRPYRELSEGQKQRALLARVLATEADLVLLDEPTAAMDAVAERETMQRLAELARTQRLAVVVVSHDLRVAAEFANQLLFVDREAPAVVLGDATTVFCHPAFRHQYGDDYCPRHPPSGHPLGPAAG
ncbi:metal ABC transporter ATP-binding protein [Archangium violaceum]|uniref:metal ABC transporter ATP-binding protein n=1 Tax=Archangium violaceum TaxID=83451 RepID=UPI00193B1C97|nr:metal ABC transporter ATP-binding protein [Archangium violaceum]QRK07716.1 metal ABC transporter ATP-binding protein [Archangium violaceum]